MKLYFEVYGCVANKADRNVMYSLLKGRFDFAKDASNADILIILTCGVKGSTENKMLCRLEKLKDKKVIVAGCLPAIMKNKLFRSFPKFSFIGTNQIDDIIDIVEKVSNGESIIDISSKPCSHKVAESKDKVQPILICTGCMGSCKYCSTKAARGNLHSFTIEEIKKSVTSAVKNGASRILITAQDTGAYGQDIGTNLVELLKELITVPGNFKMRIGMMNPNCAKTMAKELAELFKSPKIMKFVHIPVQSGSNDVLKAMGRKYSVKDFEDVVKIFRWAVPRINIASDVICGYPMETEAQFQETVELIKRIKFNVLNISKFYPRPNTPAEKLKQLDSKIIKDRTARLYSIFKDLKRLMAQRKITKN